METGEFGAKLRELRKQAGFSQRELADKIGVNFSYLSKIESGAMPPPSEKVILRLAEALNADKDELITLAGRIPSDIVPILQNRETLQFLRSRRRQKKVKASSKITSKIRGVMPMNIKTFARVALAIVLVVSIGASLWFASPTPVRAWSAAMSVANSPISGNTTHRLGEGVRIPATITLASGEWRDFQSVSLNITGPESFVRELPLLAGSYPYVGAADNVSGRLDVTIGVTSGVMTGPYGYGIGYGYGYGGTTSGNITYDVVWTPPYVLTVLPTPPPSSLPGMTQNYNISIPSDVYSATSAYASYPQGLSNNGTYLYTILPASYHDNVSHSNKDIIVKSNLSGNYISYFAAPGNSWTNEAITFIGNTLYAAYNDWSSSAGAYKGFVKTYSFASDNWTAISGLSNLDSIGGLASDGTNLFIAYRDELTIEKRNPTTGAVINTFNLSTAWGAGTMWTPMWGFDALAYDTDLYAAQGETIIKVDASTGAKTGEYKTGKWSIRGMEFVSETFSNGVFKILYIATTEWPSRVYRAAKPGDTPEVEKTPIGSYTTRFKVTATDKTETKDSSFTLGKLSVAPTVTITAPLPNFAVGAGSENITVTGTINDPSIATVLVGVALPEMTIFEDNTENATQTMANWRHSATTGLSSWMTYSSDDYWHRSSQRSHNGAGYSWRYANSSTGNFVSSTGWGANAGVLRTKNAISIGDNNKLTFWTWYDSDLDFWPDRKRVEVSTNNITWTTVGWLAKFWPPFMPPDISQQEFSSLISVPERQWTKVEIPLTAYAGQDIYLRFRFDTMDDWNNNFEGWYIDDLSITGAGFFGKTVSVDSNLGFSTNFTLAEGANTITARASRTNYDPKLSGTASVSGLLDTTNPDVILNAVTTPTKQATQTISGRVIDANFSRLEIKDNNVLKGTTTTLGTGGTFSQSIALVEGTNNIFVQVWDRVGLTDNASATISLDTVGPVFHAVFPGSANRTYDVAYQIGEISARPNDPFFVALNVSDAGSAVNYVKLVIPGMPTPSEGWPTAMKKADLPEAVIDSWGIKTTTKIQMNYIIAMSVPSGAPTGEYTWMAIAYDTAGNSSNITLTTNVVTTLEGFNIYLMPDWNLVSLPVIPTTTNITTLTASINATGLFERVWYYDASLAGQAGAWKFYDPIAGGDLTTLGAGKGYWFKMKPLTHTTNTSAIDSFTEAGKVSAPMMTGLPNTPAPVKLTILGSVLTPGALATPPTYPVYAGWNLVGLHSEYSQFVSTALQSVTVPTQRWGSLIQYLNYIYFPWERGATPAIYLGRFHKISSTSYMNPGRGFWLYMVEAGTIVP